MSRRTRGSDSTRTDDGRDDRELFGCDSGIAIVALVSM
jgi:hypothetical protein